MFELFTIPVHILVICFLGLPIVVSLGFEVVYEKYAPDRYRQLCHRQKLASMIVDNGWFEVEKGCSGKSFFDSPNFFSLREGRIKYFPKMFYRMNKGKIYINVEIPMGRLQEPMLNLNKKLETGLFCDLVEEELKEFYKEYVFLYDASCNRIGINDVVVKNGGIMLMKGLYWEFDSLPHGLIIGGTGGGKTYFILTLIEALLKSGAVLSVLDPKRADLSDLADIMPNVYYDVDDMINELKNFYEEMLSRVDIIKQSSEYQTGVNYAYVGLEPHFLIFDEYVAFMEMVGKRREEVLTYMRQIAMLGRQVGYFLILACQRPDTKYFADGMRDQFGLRVTLGKNSEMGYVMAFGSECKKQFYNKKIKGRGYIDVGTGVIREFYSPFVPMGYDFLENIRAMNLGSTEKKIDNIVAKIEEEEY